MKLKVKRSKERFFQLFGASKGIDLIFKLNEFSGFHEKNSNIYTDWIKAEVISSIYN